MSKNGIGLTENTAGISLLTGKEPKKASRYQAITQASDPHSGARVRVWRETDELPEYNDAEVQILVAKIPGSASMQDVVDILSSLDNVTRIELVDPQGNGANVYFELDS